MNVWWLALLILPASWLYTNGIYKWVYGRPLRWWAIWAATGALLFRIRLERWER